METSCDETSKKQDHCLCESVSISLPIFESVPTSMVLC